MFNKPSGKAVKNPVRTSYLIEAVAISFFGRPALGDFSDHKARQPLKFVVAFAAP